MLDYVHMLKCSAELEPKFVVLPSFVSITQFHCDSDFLKKAYEKWQKAKDYVSVSILIITCA